jgi:hypothetical protein
MTTTTRRKPVPRKGTAPRRAAAKRVGANGSAQPSGSPPVPAFDPSPAAPGTRSGFEPAPPEEFIPTTVPEAPKPPPVNPPDTPPHPYGENTLVFVFHPKPGSKAGDAPIVFPHITTIRPDYHFMWKLRKLDQIQQSFEWMDMAKVPDEIQERVTLLSDGDQGDFFLAWFSPAVTPAKLEVGLPGES